MANGRQTPAAAGQSSQDVVVSQNSPSLVDVLDPSDDAAASAPIISAPPVTPPCTPEPVAAPPRAPDPFDPARLRLSQDFGVELGVKKALITVPVRKPSREWWVRVHPDAAYQIQTAVLELKEDQETYLVAPTLWPELAAESTFSPRALFTAMNRQGVLFLWPVRLPGLDGKIDSWSRSALQAASLAGEKWVRVASNKNLGAYEVFTTTATFPEAQWPDVPFSELLRVAFKDLYIDTLDHPVLRRLRGEV